MVRATSAAVDFSPVLLLLSLLCCVRNSIDIHPGSRAHTSPSSFLSETSRKAKGRLRELCKKFHWSPYKGASARKCDFLFTHLVKQRQKKQKALQGEGNVVYNIIPFFFFFLITISFDSHPFSLPHHPHQKFTCLPSSTRSKEKSLLLRFLAGHQQHLTLPFHVV